MLIRLQIFTKSKKDIKPIVQQQYEVYKLVDNVHYLNTAKHSDSRLCKIYNKINNIDKIIKFCANLVSLPDQDYTKIPYINSSSKQSKQLKKVNYKL